MVQHTVGRLTRVAPPAGIADVVEQLWVERVGADEARVPDVLVPDGRPVVEVVAAGTAAVSDPLRRRELGADAVAHGVTAAPLLLRREGATRRVGATLRPWASGLLAGGLVTPDAVVAVDAPDLVHRVRAAGDDESAVAALAEAIEGWSAATGPRDPERADVLAAMVRRAEAAAGVLRPVDLARDLGVALPTLHRWCVAGIGVAPDTYLAAVRLAHLVGQWRPLGPDGAVPAPVALAALRAVLDAGHPAREVERMTGLDPVRLHRLVDALARATRQ